jgi:branched-chain amino acid transport system substrate-binding protein
MMKSRLWRLLALFAVFSLFVAACSDDDDSGSSTDDSTTDDSTGEVAAVDCPTDSASEAIANAEPTEESSGEASSDPTEDEVPPSDASAFQVGTLLPETGSLAFLGPPEFAGVDLAVQEINAGGGVNGETIPDAIHGDSGDTETDIATQTTDRLLNANVDVIVGAASSSVTKTVIDAITGAGVIQFSPANTAADLTDYPDSDLYFRTAPSDVLQGALLGQLIAEDGNETLGILALDDDYGTGLAGNVEDSFTEQGGEVVDTIIYDPTAQNYDAEVTDIAAAEPDAIIVIGFDESARILTSMIEAGIGPADIPVYGTDGNMGNALGEQFAEAGGAAGALACMRGTTPLTELSQDFTDRLLEINDTLIDFNYAAESYDAVVITALAANEAGSSDDPVAIAAEINGVTTEGTACDTYEECAGLQADGEDIDYDGASGPLEFSDAGEPSEASFGILTFDGSNALVNPPEFAFAQI